VSSLTTPTSSLEIDFGALDFNVKLLKSLANPTANLTSPGPKVGFCAVIKQDAYGLGAARVARRVAALGADLLAVYSLDEARALADVPIKTPVLVLMPVSQLDRGDPLYRLAVNGRLHLVLHSEQQAAELAVLTGRIGLDLPVHIQVDTGMSRGGCLPEEAQRLVDMVCRTPRFQLAGVMTHFSSPGHDEAFTKEQARLFRQWVDAIKPRLIEANKKGKLPTAVHAANTAATLRSSQLHATMIRIGQGLFGYGADSLQGDAEHIELAGPAAALRPAVRWLSRIVHIQEIPTGWPVGYANGYPLSLSNRGQVRVTGRKWDRIRTAGPQEQIIPLSERARGGVFAPVVGRVSMDQITIDLSDVPLNIAMIGSEIELIGVDPTAANHLPTLAEQAGTITHELLCRIAPNVERKYIVSDEVPAAGSGGGPGSATTTGASQSPTVHLSSPARAAVA